MANATAATPCEILPKPISPNLLPLNSVPLSNFFSHNPSLSPRSPLGICLQDARRWPMVSSTTLLVEACGVLQTTIPDFVAACKSILSTPTPALPMNFRLEDFSITSEFNFVALLMTTASKSAKAPDANSSCVKCCSTTL